MRPNGGILSRGPTGLTIPILGVTFYGATPTDSCEMVNATRPSTSQRNTTASAATPPSASRTCWPSSTPGSVTCSTATLRTRPSMRMSCTRVPRATPTTTSSPTRRLADPDAVEGRSCRRRSSQLLEAPYEGRDRSRLRAGRQSGRRHQSGVAPIPEPGASHREHHPGQSRLVSTTRSPRPPETRRIARWEPTRSPVRSVSAVPTYPAHRPPLAIPFWLRRFGSESTKSDYRPR